MSTTTQTIFETAGPIATLTFNRPDARNAMTWEMYDALVAACERVDADAGVKLLVLRGAGGKAFVAGTDISQFRSFGQPGDGVRYEARLDAVLDRLERVTKPTIAAVQGVAVGGGCAIALCCDLRVATPESSFGVPIARTLGNTLSAATCGRMLALLGPARFKELMFTGRLFSAADLHGAGVVNRIAAATEFDAAVAALAEEIVANAPLTIRSVKEMTRRLIAKARLSPDEERDLIELCYTSDDFKEGVAAFMEKRKPNWRGR
ncbi:MAG TPA: enoyl-CoA hydratase/isomerase family protein [Vicinamibacterales bacterium]|nr:enoyl-CoA hydratase/isomerase family protein [Vicinamibacterales bacterium]